MCPMVGNGFLQNLGAGALSLLAGPQRGLTAGQPEPPVWPSSSVPPLEMGSPWVTTDLNPVLVDILGSDSLPMTRDTAMRVPAVARARHTVCATLGRVPLFVTGTDSPETLAFLEQPDPHQPRFITLTWTFDDFLFHGVAWWQVTARYSSGRPRAIRRIHPGGVARKDRGQWTVYGNPVPASDLVRIDGPHEGLLNYARTTLRQAADLESSTAKTARNPIPAIDLHQTSGPTLGDTERKSLIKDWVTARESANGAVAYTSPQIEARVLGQPAEQLLISARNAAAVDIARHVGIPADAVDASVQFASMTYSTSETRMRALIDFGLAAYGTALTARLSMADLSPRGARVGLDYGQVTAPTDSDPHTPAPAAPLAPESGRLPAGAGSPDRKAAQ